MTLHELLATLEHRAADAEREGATAPVANVYRIVLEELRAVNGELAPLCTDGNSHVPPSQGRLLTVREAADQLGVPKAWLYRRAKSLPFARKLGPKTLRFDAQGLARYAASRGPR